MKFTILLYAVLIWTIFQISLPSKEAENPCNFVFASKKRVAWEKLPIKINIDKSVPPEYVNSIKMAASIWNSNLNNEIFVITNAEEHASNNIFWVSNWKFKKSEQARTNIVWRNSNIKKTTITINAKDHSFAIFGELGFNKIDLVSLMVHEFGHALGLAHVEDHSSVMFPTLATNQSRVLPSETDLSSVKCEYN